MKIINIIGINNYTLVVYYTSSACYQFAIIDEEGIILEPGEIFYTPEAALQEGKETIEAVWG
jgi:predicted RNase H-like HicB family nuclease